MERDLAQFENIDADRGRLAGESQVLRLLWALERTQGEDISERTLEVIRRCINNPELSLYDLAATFHDPLITKDAIVRAIQRLIAKASTVSGENPPPES